MSEWLKEHAWKACVGETLPWVRIPLSPPTQPIPLGALREIGAATLYRSLPNLTRIPISSLSTYAVEHAPCAWRFGRHSREAVLALDCESCTWPQSDEPNRVARRGR